MLKKYEKKKYGISEHENTTALLNNQQLQHFWTKKIIQSSEQVLQWSRARDAAPIYIFLVINVREKRQIPGETKSTWDGVYFGWVRQEQFFLLTQVYMVCSFGRIWWPWKRPGLFCGIFIPCHLAMAHFLPLN